MKIIKIRDLNTGDVFTETMQLKGREALTVELIKDGQVHVISNSSRKTKILRFDQEKQVILLKKS